MRVNDKPTIKGNISAYHLSGANIFNGFLRKLPVSPYLCSPNIEFYVRSCKNRRQQFKVQKDQTLYVPRVEGNAGDKVEFSEVLLSTAGDKFTTGKDVKSVVKAEILGHVQGDKVISPLK